jgi:hypothetical protein
MKRTRLFKYVDVNIPHLSLMFFLQRNLRDLAMNARINWEVPWAEVPARDKAKLFDVVSCHHPTDRGIN